MIEAKSLKCSICLFSSYKINDIIDHHNSLIYACVSSVNPQDVSQSPHNVIRTICPLLTFFFRLSYFSPLHRGSSQRKTAFADFVRQPGVRTVTFVKIVFSCLVMGQLLTHVDCKINWLQESCISMYMRFCVIWHSSLTIVKPN